LVQWYYDRKAATIGYIPRAGETAATLETTATTAIEEMLLLVNNTKNLRWEGVKFQYATWLGASSPQVGLGRIVALCYRSSAS
jgi:hypothetical protein